MVALIRIETLGLTRAEGLEIGLLLNLDQEPLMDLEALEGSEDRVVTQEERSQ